MTAFTMIIETLVKALALSSRSEKSGFIFVAVAFVAGNTEHNLQ